MGAEREIGRLTVPSKEAIRQQTLIRCRCPDKRTPATATMTCPNGSIAARMAPGGEQFEDVEASADMPSWNAATPLPASAELLTARQMRNVIWFSRGHAGTWSETQSASGRHARGKGRFTRKMWGQGSGLAVRPRRSCQ
jgi:hypothetical protein